MRYLLIAFLLGGCGFIVKGGQVDGEYVDANGVLVQCIRPGMPSKPFEQWEYSACMNKVGH